MLMRGYPFEMQGRLAEAIELCETAVEIARLSANPHYLFWALFELGWARYFAGDLDGTRSPRARRACGSAGACAGARCRRRAAAPGWALAVAAFELGEVDEARRADARGRRGGHGALVPRRALLQLGEPGAGRAGARERRRRPTRSRRIAEDAAAAVDLRLPTALARAHARGGAAGRRATRRGAAEAAEDSIAAADGDRRHAAGGVLAQPARARARRGRRPRGPRSRCCARPSASWTRAARCGCATRPGASCASWGRARRRAGRPRPDDSGRRLADQARAARSPT